MTRMNSSNTQHKDEVGSLLEVMMVCTESEAGMRANTTQTLNPAPVGFDHRLSRLVQLSPTQTLTIPSLSLSLTCLMLNDLLFAACHCVVLCYVTYHLLPQDPVQDTHQFLQTCSVLFIFLIRNNVHFWLNKKQINLDYILQLKLDSDHVININKL